MSRLRNPSLVLTALLLGVALGFVSACSGIVENARDGGEAGGAGGATAGGSGGAVAGGTGGGDAGGSAGASAGGGGAATAGGSGGASAGGSGGGSAGGAGGGVGSAGGAGSDAGVSADAGLGPVQCRVNGDCGGGRTCERTAPGGICQGCTQVNQCPSGNFAACVMGSCVRACSGPADCSAGMRCLAGTGRCALRLCAADGGCPSPYACGQSGFCNRPPCDMGNCPSPLVCSAGICVEP